MSAGSNPWKGLRVLITAGPTREHLDPVRFLTNASSGIMGYCLAKAARDLGARVRVVLGPSRIAMPRGVRVFPVVTGEQMFRRVLAQLPSADLVIGAAAVGDWKFAGRSAHKIKKTGQALSLTLLPNPDIVAEVCRRRRGARPVVVGFALETRRSLASAREKLARKGLDLIVANRADALGAGRARIAVLGRGGRGRTFPLLSKDQAAREILRRVEPLLPGRPHGFGGGTPSRYRSVGRRGAR